MAIFVRPERPQDHPQVFETHLRAFGRPTEARLVELVRPIAQPLVSLVALVDGRVAGHVMFTPVTVTGRPQCHAMGLAPLAVRPEMQRQGIGSRLVQVGLDALRIAAVDLVFALGEPRFYRRFGFQAAALSGLHYPNPAQDPFLMVAELRRGSLMGPSGTVRYLPEFEAAD